VLQTTTGWPTCEADRVTQMLLQSTIEHSNTAKIYNERVLASVYSELTKLQYLIHAAHAADSNPRRRCRAARIVLEHLIFQQAPITEGIRINCLTHQGHTRNFKATSPENIYHTLSRTSAPAFSSLHLPAVHTYESIPCRPDQTWRLPSPRKFPPSSKQHASVQVPPEHHHGLRSLHKTCQYMLVKGYEGK
jgi:hypothetical protein